jgi:hypothetical protein
MNELELLEQELLKPSDALIEDMKALKGDILLLGVAGKMGPSMARLAKIASDKAGTKRRIQKQIQGLNSNRRELRPLQRTS